MAEWRAEELTVAAMVVGVREVVAKVGETAAMAAAGKARAADVVQVLQEATAAAAVEAQEAAAAMVEAGAALVAGSPAFGTLERRAPRS